VEVIWLIDFGREFYQKGVEIVNHIWKIWFVCRKVSTRVALTYVYKSPYNGGAHFWC